MRNALLGRELGFACERARTHTQTETHTRVCNSREGGWFHGNRTLVVHADAQEGV